MCLSCIGFTLELQSRISKIMNEYREPCYSAALALALPDVIKSHLKIEDGSTVEVSASYVHQKPMVRFASNKKGGARHVVDVKRCEAGDLMIIVSRKINQHTMYNSAIFQLKKGDAEIISVEPTQLELYSQWPTFWLEDKKTEDKDFVIRPHAPRPGAMYMIINQPDNKDTIPNKFLMAFPRRQVDLRHLDSVRSCFGSYLVSMIEWQSGRPICGEASEAEDDWSNLVWTIYQNIENYKMKCKGVSIANGTCRASGNIIRMVTVDNGGKVSGYENQECLFEDERISDAEEWNDGFGIIHIDIKTND